MKGVPYGAYRHTCAHWQAAICGQHHEHEQRKQDEHGRADPKDAETQVAARRALCVLVVRGRLIVTQLAQRFRAVGAQRAQRAGEARSTLREDVGAAAAS
jgi:hypothetical protein